MFQKIHARQLAQTRQNKNSSNITPSKHSDLVEAFIGHSFDPHKHRGAYAILVFGQPNTIRPKTMPSRSDWEVQLAAILKVLKLPLGEGDLIIYSSDSSLMAHLGGGSLWRWRKNGWVRSNGEPLQYSGLLAQIADEMDGRSVEFACDPYAQMQKAAQAEANAALREWRDSNPGGARRW